MECTEARPAPRRCLLCIAGTSRCAHTALHSLGYRAMAGPHRPRMSSPAGSQSIRASPSRPTRCRTSLACTSAAARGCCREGRRSLPSRACTTTRPSRSGRSMPGTARRLRSWSSPHGCPERTLMAPSSQSSKRGPACSRRIDWHSRGPWRWHTYPPDTRVVPTRPTDSKSLGCMRRSQKRLVATGSCPVAQARTSPAHSA